MVKNVTIRDERGRALATSISVGRNFETSTEVSTDRTGSAPTEISITRTGHSVTIEPGEYSGRTPPSESGEKPVKMTCDERIVIDGEVVEVDYKSVIGYALEHPDADRDAAIFNSPKVLSFIEREYPPEILTDFKRAGSVFATRAVLKKYGVRDRRSL
jgi:hypothetical protein